MERHRKQLASTLVLASALIAAIATFLLPPSLQAQTQAQPKGVDPALLARAKAGDADAQFSMGLLYDNGQGATQDHAEAAAWYRKAAEQGLASAQYNLGVAYDYGQGVTQDHPLAAAWYRKAAEQGLATAQSNLGDMYYLGQGVGQDDAEAIAWYRKAADNGSTKAKAILPLLSEKTVIAASSANRGVAGNLTRAALSPQAIAKRAS
jgi:TPR repeat protein